MTITKKAIPLLGLIATCFSLASCASKSYPHYEKLYINFGMDLVTNIASYYPIDQSIDSGTYNPHSQYRIGYYATCSEKYEELPLEGLMGVSKGYALNLVNRYYSGRLIISLPYAYRSVTIYAAITTSSLQNNYLPLYINNDLKNPKNITNILPSGVMDETKGVFVPYTFNVDERRYFSLISDGLSQVDQSFLYISYIEFDLA